MVATEVVRKPVKIRRKSITIASDNGWNKGGWFAFPKPDEEPPVLKNRMGANERILWCPYCDEWEIFRRPSPADRFYCQGICGWNHSDEFYTKTTNRIWFEEVPLSELKKINIPAPAKGRR